MLKIKQALKFPVVGALLFLSLSLVPINLVDVKIFLSLRENLDRLVALEEKFIFRAPSISVQMSWQSACYAFSMNTFVVVQKLSVAHKSFSQSMSLRNILCFPKTEIGQHGVTLMTSLFQFLHSAHLKRNRHCRSTSYIATLPEAVRCCNHAGKPQRRCTDLFPAHDSL